MNVKDDEANEGVRRFEISISGLSQSDAADGAETYISDHEVISERFLHIYCRASLPPAIPLPLARMVKLTALAADELAAEWNLRPPQIVDNGYFRFTVEHYVLRIGGYRLRIADSFEETTAMASRLIDVIR